LFTDSHIALGGMNDTALCNSANYV